MAKNVPQYSLYAKVNEDLNNVNFRLPLGFDLSVSSQGHNQSPHNDMPFSSPTPAFPMPPIYHHHYTSPHPQPASHSPIHISPPRMECTLPQIQTSSPTGVIEMANKFQINISQELKNLKEKYGGSIILVFPYESSSASQEYDPTCPIPSTEGPGHWKSANFVRLPHNSENTAVPQQKNNNPQRYMESVKKWSIIKGEVALLNKFISEIRMDMSQAGNQIYSSVRKYNSKVADYTFNLLNHARVREPLRSTFPIITAAALEMEFRFPYGIPILRKDQPKTLFLTQGQIRCILANAFLCTFPKRLEVTGQELPEINFFKLFDGGARGDTKPKIEKILCILNYFKKIGTLQDEGKLLSFERRQLPHGMRPHWKSSQEKMSMIVVNYTNRIEGARDKLQVDFANRFVGGGVVGNGSVMEEIRFSICPELITARLFTEALGADEVLIITGCEQFSNYAGYGDSFTFASDFNGPSDLVDDFGRKRTQVVVMDATRFRANETQRQFEKEWIDRELNKCFCAFRPRRGQHHITAIASGNWGCGVFGGDPQLKFILQWMAASQAGQRELHYYTVGNKEQSESIMKMVKWLGRKGVRVGLLKEALKGYYLSEIKSSNFYKTPKTLFQYLEKHFK